MALNLETQFDGLSTREGFNSNLRHFRLVSGYVEDFEDEINLAELINEHVDDKSIRPAQIKPIVNALLVDKYNYHSASTNLAETVEDFSAIIEEIQNWTAVDMVLAYYSPELGLMVVNPKNPEHWEAMRILKKNELLTIYCGAFADTTSKSVFPNAIAKLIDLLEGKKFKTPAAFTGGSYTFEAPSKAAPAAAAATREPRRRSTAQQKTLVYNKEESAPAAAAPAADAAPAPDAPPKRMTPFYGITVTNELFHNGNVEAWKKIIESFEISHQGLSVLVFYDREKINDLNTLFKWGKVKRGTAIMIAVAGDEIRDVSKLQKYLLQGASSMFEAFLKGAPGKALALF